MQMSIFPSQVVHIFQPTKTFQKLFESQVLQIAEDWISLIQWYILQLCNISILYLQGQLKLGLLPPFRGEFYPRDLYRITFSLEAPKSPLFQLHGPQTALHQCGWFLPT